MSSLQQYQLQHPKNTLVWLSLSKQELSSKGNPWNFFEAMVKHWRVNKLKKLLIMAISKESITVVVKLESRKINAKQEWNQEMFITGRENSKWKFEGLCSEWGKKGPKKADCWMLWKNAQKWPKGREGCKNNTEVSGVGVEIPLTCIALPLEFKADAGIDGIKKVTENNQMTTMSSGDKKWHSTISWR